MKFIDNYDFNRTLAALTNKPHLARWAYGACKAWIENFEGSVIKTNTMSTYSGIIEDKKNNLVEMLKLKLRTKLSNNKILMGELI